MLQVPVLCPIALLAPISNDAPAWMAGELLIHSLPPFSKTYPDYSEKLKGGKTK